MKEENKHTPGPWESTHSSWDTSLVHDADGNLVCIVPINNDVTEYSQDVNEQIKDQLANQISALPELKSALEMALSDFCRMNNMVDFPPDHWSYAATKAIAKAKGETV